MTRATEYRLFKSVETEIISMWLKTAHSHVYGLHTSNHKSQSAVMKIHRTPKTHAAKILQIKSRAFKSLKVSEFSSDLCFLCPCWSVPPLMRTLPCKAGTAAQDSGGKGCLAECEGDGYLLIGQGNLLTWDWAKSPTPKALDQLCVYDPGER